MTSKIQEESMHYEMQKHTGDFHAKHAADAPAMAKRLQQAVIDNKNVFDMLRTPCVSARWRRSRARCSRSVGSTGGACSGSFGMRPRLLQLCPSEVLQVGECCYVRRVLNPSNQGQSTVL